MITITPNPTVSNFHAPVSFPIAATAQTNANPNNGAKIIFITIPNHTFLSCAASLKLPFAKVIPIANHANGVHNASKVFVTLNNGGNLLSNRNGEKYWPLVEWQPFLGLFFCRHLFLIINWS